MSIILLKNLIVAVFCFSCIGFFLSRIFKRNDLADILWGPGFLFLAFFVVTKNNFLELNFLNKILLAMVGLWALRLSLYLFLRMIRKKEEDIRYLNWRRDWGRYEPIYAYLKVYLLQSIIMGIVALPLIFSLDKNGVDQGSLNFNWVHMLGVTLFTFGFIFETIADGQLFLFKSLDQNRGKIMRTGLWGLCRHPNYFGEVLLWWGIYIFTFDIDRSFVSIVGPLLLTFLILKVSGIKMLEPILAKKSDEFAKYVSDVPAFFPFKIKF